MALRRAAACAACAAVCACAGGLLVPPDAVKNTLDAESWSRGRVRGVSGAPLHTALLAGVDGAAETYLGLARYFEDAVAEKNCALRDTPWVETLKVFSALRAWRLPDMSCISSTRHRRAGMLYSARELKGMISRMVGHLDAIAGAVNAATVGNFSTPLVPHSWPHDEGVYQQCTVQKTLGVRYRPEGGVATWYFISGLTNANTTADMPDWDRQFINEFVGVDDEGAFVDPLAMSIRKWPGEGGDVDVSLPREPFATSFELWGGRVGLSALYNMNVEEAPALVRALALSDRNADQATDALTPSNIAILALPMVLNIIPVALVADVSSIGLLVYTIMTDVLTTVPFIIKGFELMASGRQPYIAEETWFAGTASQPWIIAEAWAAECTLAHVGDVGVAFVCTGFAFLVFGIVSEWQARKWRERWLKRHGRATPLDQGLKPSLFLRYHRQAYGLQGDAPRNAHVAEEEAAFVRNQLGVAVDTTPPPPEDKGF